jgi:hypothetical protein
MSEAPLDSSFIALPALKGNAGTLSTEVTEGLRSGLVGVWQGFRRLPGNSDQHVALYIRLWRFENPELAHTYAELETKYRSSDARPHETNNESSGVLHQTKQGLDDLWILSFKKRLAPSAASTEVIARVNSYVVYLEGDFLNDERRRDDLISTIQLKWLLPMTSSVSSRRDR